MKLNIVPLIVVFLVFDVASAQNTTQTITGTVSFVTANNVYVKFDNTEAIELNKTLRINGVECLQVTEKSSTSLVCTVLDGCSPQKGDVVSYSYSKLTDEAPPDDTALDETPIPVIPPEQDAQKELAPKSTSLYQEDIRGRVSLSNYNTFSNLREDRSRFRTRFSLDALHINDSKFSVQTYLTYRSINNAGDRGRDNIFNVYNLNVRYDVLPDLSTTLGRFINPKISSLGAVDGLWVEKYFDHIYVGAIGGFRPDFKDYGFNSDLVQYGAYAGIETTSTDFYSQTTLGAMEQTNAGATDRRFIYFQHSSTIASDFNLFSSAELDIFGNSGNNTRLTNFYLSARYRFSRAANLMVSYDSRKQIIYYETYDSLIEQLLDDDLARQGIRVRLNVRPYKLLWLGASYSKRFQNDSDNKSDNIYAYASLTRIPGIGGRLSLDYNNNVSNYLKSSIISARYGREFFKNKLSGDFYYRKADYTYENDNFDAVSINYIGTTLSYRISRTWQFSVSGEMALSDLEKNYRFYTRLSKRFSSKKKK
jgi:hypothetical protein